jgi:hypothetical protein
MKKAAIILLCLHHLIFTYAQQDLGIRNGNYAGIQSVGLNPSAIADSKLKWDINLFSASTVYDNTFLYIPRDSLHIFGFGHIIRDIINEEQFFTHFNAEKPNELYHVTFSNEVLGPSFMMSVGKHAAIGLTTAQRTYGNINDITGHFGRNAFVYLQEQDLWNQTFHDGTARLNSMGWLEYGLSYATVIYANGKNKLKGGITLKYLQGIAGAYFKNTDITYNISDPTAFTFTNSSINYGRTDYNSLIDGQGINDFINGHGWGGNVGVTYVRLKEPYHENSEQTVDANKNDYLYRVGLSVIDIGSIKFDRNSQAYHLEAASANYSNWKQQRIYNNAYLDKTLSAVFYQNDSTKSLINDHFHMGLPSAISLQADWNFYKNFFVNATIIKNLNGKTGTAVIRPDVYSLTPRYEKKLFEVSVPISLIYYGHWQPRIGLAARFGWFFIGGDALGGLLKLNDFEGADFYMGVHFFITKKNR